ncbi:peptidoglycan-binding protein [Photobacterium sp. Hal280]|uniref:peptidoglycan-binding protein n=1 Tax=Photobacterium sp. Hal280 TaxID=3035163 RepID=UPI00301DD058
MKKVRYVKANYTPLEDITPLPRNVVNQPIEPVPEHKLVVELAGQWQGNRAYFQLAKTEMQDQKITRPIADVKTGHRTLATFKALENEAKKLYMVVPLQGLPQPLTFLLADNLMPVEKEADMDEWETVLIPVRALAYLDSSKDKDKAAELKGGYLYVFWKGKLWRELQVTEFGYYKDIDSEYYRVRDQQERQKEQPVIEYREANGFDLPQFWVPYKIAGEVQAGENGVKVIYSPRQMSFIEIEKIESSPEELSKRAVSLDELSIYSNSKTFSEQDNSQLISLAKVSSMDTKRPWFSSSNTILSNYQDSNTPVIFLTGGISYGKGIVLQDQYGNPYSNSPYELKYGEKNIKGETNDDGFVPFNFETDEKQVFISFMPDPENEHVQKRMVVKLNSMSEVSETVGLQQRLMNLGLYCGNIDGQSGVKTENAIKELQFSHHCEITGENDKETNNIIKNIEAY